MLSDLAKLGRDVREIIATAPEWCPTCDGRGYIETWTHDPPDVLVTLCTDCGPAPGDYDG